MKDHTFFCILSNEILQLNFWLVSELKFYTFYNILETPFSDIDNIGVSYWSHLYFTD